MPSHIRVVLRGSRISDTHFPPRHRIPRYNGCLFEDEDDEDDDEDEAMVINQKIFDEGFGFCFVCVWGGGGVVLVEAAL